MFRMILAGLALILTCSCSGDGSDGRAHMPTPPAVSIAGTLASDSECFYLDEADGVRHVLVLTRPTVRADGRSVTYRGHTFLPGDHMEVFGGTTPQATTRGPMVSVDLSGCDPDAEPWIVY